MRRIFSRFMHDPARAHTTCVCNQIKKKGAPRKKKTKKPNNACCRAAASGCRGFRRYGAAIHSILCQKERVCKATSRGLLSHILVAPIALSRSTASIRFSGTAATRRIPARPVISALHPSIQSCLSSKPSAAAAAARHDLCFIFRFYK